ncbi:ABC-2 type transport system ATP-binding protein [Lachnotalea glycerini]|uniref:ABC-2 type transport system ATP-binding protein n=1 Tax=Lachnotalea glycerini TaxID=1763509 RepID=A0A318EKE6_9FIRM|nr:ABC transporter ATP-binding protein [Lachnotalea glycerini]PXV89074.1 ABC-2 type transport system ATP-binding protein [Lachnotalea glycerini]
MEQSVIEILNLTKDYGDGRGIFNTNLIVKQGEVFGFLGPNGAGKSTTIRNLMGFIRPDGGSCKIMGMDCYLEADKIQARLGYLAGEISFIDGLTGKQMLDFIADMKGIKDKSKMHELMQHFELNSSGKIKKMSKGMKQKVAIICAFMGEPDVIILDEPTSGLDPLMQNKFIDLILEEKKKGKTIFISSHIFEEIERTCDRTAIIRKGRLVAIEDMKSLNKRKKKSYIITFQSIEQANQFLREGFDIIDQKDKQITVAIQGDINPFIHSLAHYEIKNLDIKIETIEEIFMHFYGEENQAGGDQHDRKGTV